MNTNFKNFVELTDLVQQHGAIFVPESLSWAKEIYNLMPSLDLDLDLPTVEKRAKIDYVMDKKNPIYVQLSDGSKLFFSLDEFRRIKEKPQKGKTMVVIMLRLPHDKSERPSQIKKCHVI